MSALYEPAMLAHRAAPRQTSYLEPLVIDIFAGAGGASIGIEAALGRPVDIAVNHDAAAIRNHLANHPKTFHHHCDIFEVNPREVCQGRRVGLLWASPDCTHHSKAKGGKPRSKKIRALAWVVIKWAALARPDVIMLENVEEFASWGPLDGNGHPCKRRKGETFRRWLKSLRDLGYAVQHRELVAADYGAPTTRKRLFVIARCDGKPIVWPEPTHGAGLKPWRSAAECIDWSLPCPSIFDRRKPLAVNTLKRIARGLKKFVLDNPKPFVISIDNASRQGGAAWSADDPLRTVVTPTVVNVANGKTTGRGPNVWPPEYPLRTITTFGGFAVVAPHLQKFYGGVTGSPVDSPLGTVTGIDHHGLCAAYLSKFRRETAGAPADGPMPTLTAGGTHIAEVRAFLVKYYGCGVGQPVDDPVHTLTTRDRMGLVVINGEDWQIVDIGLRMLQPRELLLAQGFPAWYRLDGPKYQQVRLIGNSVPPPFSEALVRANCADMIARSTRRRHA